MKRTLVFAAIGLMGITDQGRTIGDEPAPRAAQPSPLTPPKIGRRDNYRGRVLEVTRDSITVQGLPFLFGGMVSSKREGRAAIWVGWPLRVYRENEPGTVIKVASGVSAKLTSDEIVVTRVVGGPVTFRRADVPPKKFKASAALVAGGYYPDMGDAYTYRLSDVRVGDEVTIEAREVDGVWECVGVCIDRRPGGRVPPSSRPDERRPHHEWANAYQNLIDNDVPLPAKFATEPGIEPGALKPPPSRIALITD